MWSSRGGVQKEKSRESSSVYLLFSALRVHDQLALLNWDLNAHTAVLKLSDGCEGINSNRCLGELLHSNGTIT